VVTDLHNYASPVLRYEIGDYAEVASPCQCGRGLPAIKRIIGRERNMWVRPDGRRAWPSITSKKMRAAAPYQQLQMEQKSIDLIVVRLVPEGSFDDDHKQALTAAIHQCLGFRTNLEFEIVDSIKRGHNGKFEEFICRI
jgi:phenylacetate-CoA ligase